jgi:hypothetical protein
MNDELESDQQLGPAERELGERLAAARPVPAARFRGDLGRRLDARDPGYGPRPTHLRTTASACLGGSLIVMGLGLLQALGVL